MLTGCWARYRRDTSRTPRRLHVGFVTDEASALRAVPMPSTGWSPETYDVSGSDRPEDSAQETILDLCSRPFDVADGRALPHRGACASRTRTTSWGHGAPSRPDRRLRRFRRPLPGGSPSLLRGCARAVPVGGGQSGSLAGSGTETYRKSPLFQEDADFWQDYLGRAAPAARLPSTALPPSEVTGGRWDSLGTPLGVSCCIGVIPRAQIEDALSAQARPGVAEASPDLVMASVVGFISASAPHPTFTFSFTVNFRHGAYRKAPGLYSNAVPTSASVPLEESTADLARRLGGGGSRSYSTRSTTSPS